MPHAPEQRYNEYMMKPPHPDRPPAPRSANHAGTLKEKRAANNITERDSSEGWLPEQPLLLYPSVACHLGVEEALLLQVLMQYRLHSVTQHQNGYDWITLTHQQLSIAAPFWQARDIQRLATNLREANVLLLASAPYLQSQVLKFALKPAPDHAKSKAITAHPTATPHTVSSQSTMAEASAAHLGQQQLVQQQLIQQQLAQQQVEQQTGQQQALINPAHQQTSRMNMIAPHWQPERNTLNQLAQHNIPESFALSQVGEFITYWRERNEAAHSWNAKFHAHIIHKWREHQAQQNQRPQATFMQKDWRPSEDALEVLSIHAGINQGFIEDAIPEFVLYWREQGASSDNWNRRFRDHVNRQWARYNAALEHDTTPRRIAAGWQPSRDVYDVLKLANIDLQFAQQIVPEFVIYWRDSNQVHSSWNTRFLQYVKRRWAQRGIANPQNSTTRDLSLEALVTDRSWAD